MGSVARAVNWCMRKVSEISFPHCVRFFSLGGLREALVQPLERPSLAEGVKRTQGGSGATNLPAPPLHVSASSLSGSRPISPLTSLSKGIPVARCQGVGYR